MTNNKTIAIERYRQWLTFRNYAKGTITDYIYCFSGFANSLPEDTDFFNLDVQLAIDYVFRLRSKGLSPASTNLLSSSLRCYYDVILDRPISIRRLPNVKYTLGEPNTFSESEISRLLDAADVRMKAMIFLGCDCGLRISEVVKLRIKDVDSQNMLLHIVHTKRDKSRYVKLSVPCLEALHNYWLVYRPDPSGYMFPGKVDGHLDKSYTSQLFHRLIVKLELRPEDGLRFHNLRDSYATSLRNNGCDIFTLRKALGHSTLKSTARYIAFSTSDIQNMPSPSDFRKNSHVQN
jgi:integrase/recombinase XerD